MYLSSLHAADSLLMLPYNIIFTVTNTIGLYCIVTYYPSVYFFVMELNCSVDKYLVLTTDYQFLQCNTI